MFVFLSSFNFDYLIDHVLAFSIAFCVPNGNIVSTDFRSLTCFLQQVEEVLST